MIRSSRGSLVIVIPRLVSDTGSLCISMLMGERGGMAGGREGAVLGVDEAIVKVLSPISVMEPLVLACLEKRSLLSRLERSSAPCLAPSFPEIGHLTDYRGRWRVRGSPRWSAASLRLTSRWMSDMSVSAWWVDNTLASAWTFSRFTFLISNLANL